MVFLKTNSAKESLSFGCGKGCINNPIIELPAALARRAANGQKKRKMTRGFTNDVRAKSAYAPYVDAMFVDKEYANLLSERPLSLDLDYKVKVFSLVDTESFLSYLTELEEKTPADVGYCA